jgi:hypothetical protein
MTKLSQCRENRIRNINLIKFLVYLLQFLSEKRLSFYILTVRGRSAILKLVVNVIEMFCLLLLKADIQSNPWIFSDRAQQ